MRSLETTTETRGETMAARTATAPKSPQKLQRELEDLQLVLKVRNGSKAAQDELMRRYHGFVRLKASSFRSFAELCVTRQIITAIKSATRYKHAPLNTYVSFSHTPAGQDVEGECTLGDALPGPSIDDPSVRVISTEELQALVGCLGTTLSGLESEALRLYLDGNSYEQMAEILDCDCKTIDNALQRVKRKILAHQAERAVPA